MSEDNIQPRYASGSQDWSYTKSQLFERCPRKFHFKERVSVDGIQRKELPSSDAVNLGAIVGIAVHKSIASQIENWNDGEPTSFQDALQEAENWINNLWAEKENRIIEIKNGTSVQESTRRRLSGATKKHLRTFFQAVWPRFRNHEYILHETLKTFDVDGNQVWVKVDLCTRDQEGNLVLTDWKTSERAVLEADSRQLDVYSLWGRNGLEPNIDNIQVQLVHTRTGEFSTSSPDPTRLKETVDEIAAECDEWTSSNDTGDFPPNPGPDKCRGCRFLQICDTGQAEVSQREST